MILSAQCLRVLHLLLLLYFFFNGIQCFSHYVQTGFLLLEVGRVSLFALAARKLTGKFYALSLWFSSILTKLPLLLPHWLSFFNLLLFTVYRCRTVVTVVTANPFGKYRERKIQTKVKHTDKHLGRKKAFPLWWNWSHFVTRVSRTHAADQYVWPHREVEKRCPTFAPTDEIVCQSRRLQET